MEGSEVVVLGLVVVGIVVLYLRSKRKNKGSTGSPTPIGTKPPFKPK